jgi:CheY-like chemotaxis protein
VIDDEPAVRAMAQTALESYGYTVLVAQNGQDALELLARNGCEIHLVLLDMTMPKMGGERTIVELKKIKPDIPVVVSSGYSEAEVIPRFQGFGLAGFLQKPYSTVTLAAKVKKAMAPNSGASLLM